MNSTLGYTRSKSLFWEYSEYKEMLNLSPPWLRHVEELISSPCPLNSHFSSSEWRENQDIAWLCIAYLNIQWVKVMEKVRKAPNLNIQSRMEQVRKNYANICWFAPLKQRTLEQGKWLCSCHSLTEVMTILRCLQTEEGRKKSDPYLGTKVQCCLTYSKYRKCRDEVNVAVSISLMVTNF